MTAAPRRLAGVAAAALLPWRAARRIREQDESIRVLILALDAVAGAAGLPAPRPQRPALTLIRGDAQ